MFGTNSIIGKKFFRDSPEVKEGKLLVTSMFYTLQGEGPYRGEPAFFIRLAKCNLACSFCDTFFDSGTWLTIDEIFERIDQKITEFFNGNVPRWAQFLEGYHTTNTPPKDRAWAQDLNSNGYWIQSKKRHMTLVITGGEPSLQDNLRDLLLIGKNEFKKTQIESNGMFVPPVPDKTTVVISPKCIEKDGVAIRYSKPLDEVLLRADCLKFVMEASVEHKINKLMCELEVLSSSKPVPGLSDQIFDIKNEIRYINNNEVDTPYSSIPDWAHKWADDHPNRNIYISPMNVYRQLPKRAKELRANNEDTTIEQRSDYDEVVSFWEEGLLDMKANQRNHEHAAKYAITHGFIFNVQIHLLASLA